MNSSGLHATAPDIDWPRRTVLIFAVALGVRWAYALAVQATLGRSGLLGPDSVGYSMLAAEFVASASLNMPTGFAWLGPDAGLMPLFFLCLAAAHAIAGTSGDLVFVLAQCVIDAFTCVVVASMARAIDPRIATAANMG